MVSKEAEEKDTMYTISAAQDYFGQVINALQTVELHQIWRAMELISRQGDRGNTVWIVGNGGSAATADHFANDLIKMGGLRAIALSSMVPVITAFGNDEGWDCMFRKPLKTLMGPGDVLVAISCSGASMNVLECARQTAMERLIVMTGPCTWQNELKKLPCYAKLSVNTGDIRVVEDVHSIICHALAGLLKPEGV